MNLFHNTWSFVQIVLIFTVTSSFVQGILAAQDEQLDSFSNYVRSQCQFTWQPQSYSIGDDVVTIDISKLSAEDRSQPLKVNLLNLYTTTSPQSFAFKDFKTVLFINGQNEELIFEGIQAICDSVLAQNDKQIIKIPPQYNYYLLKTQDVSKVTVNSIEIAGSNITGASFIEINGATTATIQSFHGKSFTQDHSILLSFNQVSQQILINSLIIENSDRIQVLLVQNSILTQIELVNLNNIQVASSEIAILEFDQNTDIVINQLIIQNSSLNFRHSIHTIQVNSANSFSVSNGLIFNNTISNATPQNSIQFINAISVLQFNLNKLTMKQNTAGSQQGTFISVDSYIQGKSSVSITDCIFQDNQSFSDGGVMFLSTSAITIDSSTFENIQSYGSGGSIYIDKTDTLSIKDSTFTNNTSGDSGGAIFINKAPIPSSNPAGDQLYFQNVLFFNNTSLDGDGGAVSFNQISTTQFENCNLTQNYATLGKGGAIYVKFAQNFYLANSNIVKNSAMSGGGIHLDQINFVFFMTSQIQGNIANSTGGGIAGIIINELLFLQEITLEENIGDFGGAIYSEAQSLQLTQSRVIGNYATSNGGGIYSIKRIDLKDTVISKNKANIGGGGIFISVFHINILYPYQDTTSKISENSAYIGGGILYKTMRQPTSTYDTPYEQLVAITVDNKSVLFGSNISQIPVSMELEQAYQYDEDTSTLIPLVSQQSTVESTSPSSSSQIYTVQSLKSASTVVFMWKFVGADPTIEISPNNPSMNDFNNILNISYDNQNSLLNEDSSNLIEKRVPYYQNQIISSKTLFTTTLFLIGDPLSQFHANFTLQLGPDFNIPIQTKLQFRKCIIGEIYLKQQYSICYECKSGTYSFDDPDSPTASCQQKPNEVAISYGNTWIMDQGYWRDTTQSTDILTCSTNTACIGGNGSGDQLCGQGYESVVCGSCSFNNDIQYSKSLFNNSCTECSQKQTLNIILIIACGVYSILAIYLVVRLTVRDSLRARVSRTLVTMKALVIGRTQTQRGQAVVYSKMLLHYFQLSLPMWFFQVQRFNISEVLFVIPKFMGDTLGTAVQFSTCFLSPSSSLTSESPMFTQLLITEIFPPLLFVLIVSVLLIFRKFNKISWNDLMLYAYNLFWFFFCGFFSLSMLKALVFVSACSHVGTQQLMFSDYNIDCNSNTTRRVILFAFIAPIFAGLCAFLPLKLLQIFLDEKLYPNRTTNENTSNFISLQLINLSNRNTVNNKESHGPTVEQNQTNQRNQLQNKNNINTVTSNISQNIQNKEDIYGNSLHVIDLHDGEGDQDGRNSNTVPLLGSSKKSDRYKLTINTARELRFGYLLMGYRLCYWEVVRMLLREMILVAIMFFNEIPDFGGSISVAMLLLYLFALHRLKPFKSSQLNQLEKESTIVSIICLFFFVIIQMVDGDYRFDVLADVLTAAIYFLFFWFIFKMTVMILASLLEDTKYSQYVQILFNKLIPNTFLVQGNQAIKKWKILRKNIKKIRLLGKDNIKNSNISDNSFEGQVKGLDKHQS